MVTISDWIRITPSIFLQVASGHNLLSSLVQVHTPAVLSALRLIAHLVQVRKSLL